MLGLVLVVLLELLELQVVLVVLLELLELLVVLWVEPCVHPEQ